MAHHPRAFAKRMTLAAVILTTMAIDFRPEAAPAGDPKIEQPALSRIRKPPLGLPDVPIPESNPPTSAKIRLGRKLFLDRRLSRNGTLSCAMCHVPEQGFTVNEVRTSVGNEGKSLRRNAPSLLNTAYFAPFFHDGREPELDLQPFDVFVHPDEMAAPSIGALVAKVRAFPDYTPLFDGAFGKQATVASIGQALGSYMRTLLAAGSPFDRWRFGKDDGAMNSSARNGFGLFSGKANCAACHLVQHDSALFTDHAFHDTGLGWYATTVRATSTEPILVEIAPGVVTRISAAAVAGVGNSRTADLGRYEVTGDPHDRWRFKTPSLRNVALTAPYMHDGSFSTLREVVDFYDRGAHRHDGLDPLLQPLGLDEQEKDDLVAFLESLTGANIDELVRDARSERVGNPGD